MYDQGELIGKELVFVLAEMLLNDVKFTRKQIFGRKSLERAFDLKAQSKAQSPQKKAFPSCLQLD